MNMYTRQPLHLALLGALLAGVFACAYVYDGVLAGQLWGLPTVAWLALAIATPIVHQVYVWFVWRSELVSQWTTRRFGENGFFYYAAGFTILFVGRLLTIIALAFSNRGTLALSPALAYTLAFVLLIPSLYLFYSVRTYFGFKRAYGIDHFDESYRGAPFVRQGIFRLSSNAMYVFGFLLLWIPGLLLFSQAALLAAAFNHLYIWVHYYCTELPDMHAIYGEQFYGEQA